MQLIELDDLVTLLAFKSLPKSITVRRPFLTRNGPGLYINEHDEDGQISMGCFYNLNESQVVHANYKWKLWIDQFLVSGLTIITYLERELAKKKNELLHSSSK